MKASMKIEHFEDQTYTGKCAWFIAGSYLLHVFPPEDDTNIKESGWRSKSLSIFNKMK
jgi:hypothetical protein